MSILRTRREARGLTLVEAAAAVQTNAGNLSRIERGGQFPGRELARRLADFYGLKVDQVLYPDPPAAA